MKELRECDKWWRYELNSLERTKIMKRYHNEYNSTDMIIKEAYKRHLITEKLKLL